MAAPARRRIPGISRHAPLSFFTAIPKAYQPSPPAASRRHPGFGIASEIVLVVALVLEIGPYTVPAQAGPSALGRMASSIRRTLHRHARAVERVGEDHRGGHVGVAQQVLHGADVRSGLEQAGGEGVTQHMRRDPDRRPRRKPDSPLIPGRLTLSLRVCP